jgi:iron complex outermembrane receptor protein
MRTLHTLVRAILGKNMKLKAKLTLIATAISLQFMTTNSFALAQEASAEGEDDVEIIMVTARKRQESIIDVPLSITALNSEQIEAQKVRNLASLAVGIPNVSFDDIATTAGTANFSIRGIGINSSIASIDPTVGVFVDGVYMGVNTGIIFDTFDISSIEVLRGPQGILFGRNVTGGAVLITTKKPSDVFEASFRVALEGGGEKMNRYVTGTVSGPLSDTVAAKLAIYTNKDDGWHKNLFNNQAFGKNESVMVRPSITWQATDDTEWIFRYEYQNTKSDGPASQSHTNGQGLPGTFGNFDRDSFDFSIDNEGFANIEANFFSVETNIDVEFGNGTITNIFGWRDLDTSSESDIDASPQWLFHAPAWLTAEQFSNELRYNGQFDNTNVTAGVYYFENSLVLHERRNLLGIATGGVAPALTQDGGGLYDVTTAAIFLSADHDIDEKWSVNGGLRYTYETKDAQIASLVRNVNALCFVPDGTCSYDFVDDAIWTAVSPKIGVKYQASRTQNLYAHWTRGFRSGGYNLRNTAIDTVNLGPGPFDQEKVDNIEIGYKARFENGTFNAAYFHNQIDNMQREVNLSDPFAGVVQVIKNTANATISGFEFDATYEITDDLNVIASLGYTDAKYDDVIFDLNSDGEVTDADKNLDIPRAPQFTYAFGLNHTMVVGDWGEMVSRISYAYRDESAYTDNNLGFITDQNIVDLGVDLYSDDGKYVIGIYGKNMLNEVKHGGDTQLPSVLGPVQLGGTFSPLAKGRVFGVEFTINFE